MTKELQTSKEILDSFFHDISEREDLDKNTVDALVELYNQNKFTKTNVTNALMAARESKK